MLKAAEEIALQNLLLIAKEVKIDSVSVTSALKHQNKTKSALYAFGDSTNDSLLNNNNFVGLLQSKIWVKFVYNNFISNSTQTCWYYDICVCEKP